ncbi:hypothetical protein N0V88_004159 [Collariella sp. IMI 366227]|nr:hypothetical protein N0V88_004159 [Collariella sp. IMI 366227]
MSEIPDRFEHLFHGGTGFGRALSCEYPSAASFHSHADFAGDHHRDHDEPASSPAPSDDFSDLFDWEGYERGDDAVTDVTAQSDAPSERPPAAQPLIQIPGGPAAVAPSHEDEDDVPMLDAPSEKPPHPVGRPAPRDLNIHVDSSPPLPIPYPSADMPSPLSRKKTRIVKDPEETSEVRILGACYRCRMSRAKCGRNMRLPEIITLIWRWDWNDQESSIPNGFQFVDNHSSPLFISFSPNINSPVLKVAACPFNLPNQRVQGLQGLVPGGIKLGATPSNGDILDWSEKQILCGENTGFEAEMDSLLSKFVRRHEAAPLLVDKPHEEFLSKLLEMRCMWKVWSCNRLFFRKQPGSPAFEFDSRVASIQESLRAVAARRISQLEQEVLSHVETHVVKARKDEKGAEKRVASDPKMQCTRDIVKWLSLWQIILMYRQSLRWVLEQQQQADAPPVHLSVMPNNPKKYTFRETTNQLLEILIVIYSGSFLKKTAVCNVRDAGSQAFEEDWDLCATYQRAWQQLPEFYEQTLRQISPADELFVENIVKKELEFLGLVRPTRK